MARRARMQMAMTKGVLDPGLGERIDLVHYYQAVRTGNNVEFLAQGGFKRRAGRRLASERPLRRQLAPVPLTSSMLTAHNGGVTASLVDQDVATIYATSAAAGAVFVVVEANLGQVLHVACVDLLRVASTVGRSEVIGVEYWDGFVWQAFGGPETLAFSVRQSLTASPRTLRFATAPGEIIATQFVRVVAYDADGIGIIGMAGLSVWSDTGRTTQSVRTIPFAKSSTEVAQLILTDHNIDVFEDGVYLASLAVPIPGELVDEINLEQSQDTLLLFHEDIETRRIVREGKGDAWDSGVAPFTSPPFLTSSMAFGSARDEVQEIALPGFAAGQRLVLMLGDLLAPAFTTTTAADLPAQIVAALGALPGVVVAGMQAQLGSSNPVSVVIGFGGANGSRAWPRIVARGLDGAAVAAVSTVSRRGLPVVSATGPATVLGALTGWPRTGAIWQGRLILGGFRSAPQTILCSRAGNVFDLQVTGSPLTADLGFLRTLDTDAVEAIEDIFVGRHLQVFTEQGNWWSDNRVLDATQPINFILASRYGVERSVPLVFAENATLFLEAGGRIVRDFLYSDASQSYEAEALSLLAPHLVTGARSVGYRRAATTAECNHLTVVNEDGSVALLSLLRRQEVIAWAHHTTPAGRVRETMTDLLDAVWYVVERGGDLWLERRDETALTDATVTRDIGALGLVDDLPACLEGRQVWALVGGDIYGPHTVTGGRIMLSVTEGTAEIGLDFGVSVEGLDFREQLQSAQPFRPPCRIYEAELAIAGTGYIEFGANGLPPEEVPLRHMDGGPLATVATGDEPDQDALDVPMMQRLYTGRVTIEHLDGWTETGRWSISQSRPAPMTVRSVRLELAMRG